MIDRLVRAVEVVTPRTLSLVAFHTDGRGVLLGGSTNPTPSGTISGGYGDGIAHPVLFGNGEYIECYNVGGSTNIIWWVWHHVHEHSTPGAGHNFQIARGRDGSGNGWSLILNGGFIDTMTASVVVTSGGAASYSASGNTVDRDRHQRRNRGWQFYALAMAHANGISAYSNGVHVARTTFTKQTLRTSSVGTRIGGNAASSGSAGNQRAAIALFGQETLEGTTDTATQTRSQIEWIYQQTRPIFYPPSRRIFVGLPGGASSGSASFNFSPSAVGSSHASATGTASFILSPTAAGGSSTTASGTATFAFTASAVGSSKATGSGTADFSFSPSAVGGAGDAPSTGTASFNLNGSAVGSSKAHGEGTASFAFTATADGTSLVRASGTASFSFSPSGKSPPRGVAVFTFTASAVGTCKKRAAGTAEFDFSPSATTPPPLVPPIESPDRTEFSLPAADGQIVYGAIDKAAWITHLTVGPMHPSARVEFGAWNETGFVKLYNAYHRVDRSFGDGLGKPGGWYPAVRYRGPTQGVPVLVTIELWFQN